MLVGARIEVRVPSPAERVFQQFAAALLHRELAMVRASPRPCGDDAAEHGPGREARDACMDAAVAHERVGAQLSALQPVLCQLLSGASVRLSDQGCRLFTAVTSTATAMLRAASWSRVARARRPVAAW